MPHTTNLESAAQQYYDQSHIHSLQTIDAFKAGAEWQKEQSQWISVKEQLPTLNISVLICEITPSSITHAVSYWDGTRDSINDRPMFPDGQDEQPGYFYPTHWMPLPPPPENI